MAYKRHCAIYPRTDSVLKYRPTIYKKVGSGVILSTDYPTTNLKPDDFEIDNMIKAGVNTDSTVKYEEPNTIDRIDSVLGRVVDTNITLDEKELSNKKND